MKPSNYTSFPWDSVSQNTETEIVAQNIMKILKRTGDTFRILSWEEYKEERMKDGNFSENECGYFLNVRMWCISSERADDFCKDWRK